MRASSLLLTLTLSAAPPAAAEEPPAPSPLELSWHAEATFFGDNTEFFNDFREGETIFGAQFDTWLALRPSDRTEVRIGVHGNELFTEDPEFDPVLPILSFRYRGGQADVILGTLETEDRHGFLEALEVRQLELTRPIETGGQVLLHAGPVTGDVFINWQKLNTPEHRERFDYGVLLQVEAMKHLDVELQLHGQHEGGQLYASGEVRNNVAWGPGMRAHGTLPGLGESEVTLWRLHSKSSRDEKFPPGRSTSGEGWLLRAAASPWKPIEAWVLAWEGEDFQAADGDRHYGSRGLDPDSYLQDRSYQEVGARWRHTGRGNVGYDAEIRLHRIEEEIDYSYRFLVRVGVGAGPWRVGG